MPLQTDKLPYWSTIIYKLSTDSDQLLLHNCRHALDMLLDPSRSWSTEVARPVLTCVKMYDA